MEGDSKRHSTPATSEDSYNDFMQCFKYYKRKQPPPDLGQVIDFDDFDRFKGDVTAFCDNQCDERTCGLLPPSLWKIFALNKVPGCLFIRNPFLPGYLQYVIHRCVQCFPAYPNKFNKLSSSEENELQHVNLWQHSLQWMQNTGGSLEQSPFNKLRWATLGYHHDWDTKVYTADNMTPFPCDMSRLAQHIASVVGYRDFRPEAAIVNYYHPSSTLAGHQDHSEYDMEAPLLSISFGLPAIFLIGGDTKDTVPVPILLREGDIIIMTGSARKAYHAVPRILKNTADPLNTSCCGAESQKSKTSDSSKKTNISNIESTMEMIHDETDFRNDQAKHGHGIKQSDSCNSLEAGTKGADAVGSHVTDIDGTHTDEGSHMCLCQSKCWRADAMSESDWLPLQEYMSSSRINLNIRQVFKPGQAFNTLGDG